MFQGLVKHISPKVHWRLGAYSVNEPSHACWNTGGVTRGSPICSTNLMQDCIFDTKLAAGDRSTGRPLGHLSCCQLLHNGVQRNFSFLHNLFTSSQIPIYNSRREFHRHSSHIDFVIILMTRLINLWSNIHNEFFYKLVEASSNLVHCLHKTSISD